MSKTKSKGLYLKLLILLIITVNIFAQEFTNSTNLTPREKNYLTNKKQLKLCIGPDSMPFEDFNKIGEQTNSPEVESPLLTKN